MKPEFLMLAHVFNPDKDRIGGWWLSEKLDGTRAFWDGGISKGLPAEDVPYANTIKDARFVKEQIATGLWSRSGKVIHAPDWWLDELPERVLLDGELWMGYGRFQELRSAIVNSWEEIKFMVFDSPGLNFFNPRDIKIRNEYSFTIEDSIQWALDRNINFLPSWPFELRYLFLKNSLKNEHCKATMQYKLPLTQLGAINEIAAQLKTIVDDGGEGVMLRWGSSSWVAERSYHLLKHKPINKGTGVVIGYTAGVGRLQGLIGALILRLENGKQLKLSGMTDEQREIDDFVARGEAILYPGDILPEKYSHHLFPKGAVIEFKYRELTDDGIPKESRYYKVKND